MTANASASETAVREAISEAITTSDGVLATLVGVDGSAYRRPGAKMVITGESERIGAITPGCLDEEIRTLADAVRTAGEPRLERFDLTGDDDGWGVGVGCDGVIEVLLEPLDERIRPVVDALETTEQHAVVTVLDADGTPFERGERIVARQDASGGETDEANLTFESSSWPESLERLLVEPASELRASGASERLTLHWEGGTIEVFIDSLQTPPELVVCGSHHDAVPVIELATRAGFRVTLVSFRGGVDTSRFAGADRVLTTAPNTLSTALAFDADTYVVLLSHNFVDDRLALDAVRETAVEYIGLVGSRGRFERMRDAFVAEGNPLDEADRDRIYTPAGLDLGGDTPFHIAQSIVAEITAIHHDRTPAHLSEQQGSIHPRPALASKGDDDDRTAASERRSQ